MTRQLMDYQALYEIVDARRRELGLSWRQVTARALGNYHPSLPRNLQDGRGLNAETLACLMVWTGVYDIRLLLTSTRASLARSARKSAVMDEQPRQER